MKKWLGLDRAIMGTVLTYQEGERVPVYVYSGAEIVAIYMERDNMTQDEAMEFLDFNVESAYIGKDTPLLLWPAEDL